MKDITIAVEYSGKTITSISSIAYWNVDKAARFETGDLNTAKCKLLGADFEKDNNGEIKTASFELVGVTSLDKIAEDNIVEIYTDGKASPKITKVAVGTEVVEGSVTKVNSDNDKFTINGKAYKWATATAQKIGATKPDATDEGKAYLNAAGKIADWDETDATADNYAIFLGYESSTSYNKTTHSVKLFTKEGKEVEYDLKGDAITQVTAGAVNHDGTAVNPLTTDGVLRYALSSDGKVKSFTTYDPSGLYGVANKNGTTFAKTPVKSTVVVFVYDGSDWSIGSMKDISTDNDTKVGNNGGVKANVVDLTFIGLAKNGDIGAIAVTDDASGSDNSYGVIDDFYWSSNSSGDKYWFATGFVDGAELDKITDDETPGVCAYATATTTAGLQKITIDGSGKVTGVDVAAVKANDLEDALTKGAVYHDGSARNLAGIAVTQVDRDGRIVKVTQGAVELAISLESDAVVYIYDVDDGWTQGTIQDISTDCYVEFYQTSDKYSTYNVVLAWDKEDDNVAGK